eukprot:4761448-Amphidinium_carterae.1
MANAMPFSHVHQGNHHSHFKSGYLSHAHSVNHEAIGLAKDPFEDIVNGVRLALDDVSRCYLQHMAHDVFLIPHSNTL